LLKGTTPRSPPRRNGLSRVFAGPRETRPSSGFLAQRLRFQLGKRQWQADRARSQFHRGRADNKRDCDDEPQPTAFRNNGPQSTPTGALKRLPRVLQLHKRPTIRFLKSSDGRPHRNTSGPPRRNGGKRIRGRGSTDQRRPPIQQTITINRYLKETGNPFGKRSNQRRTFRPRAKRLGRGPRSNKAMVRRRATNPARATVVETTRRANGPSAGPKTYKKNGRAGHGVDNPKLRDGPYDSNWAGWRGQGETNWQDNDAAVGFHVADQAGTTANWSKRDHKTMASWREGRLFCDQYVKLQCG